MGHSHPSSRPGAASHLTSGRYRFLNRAHRGQLGPCWTALLPWSSLLMPQTAQLHH